MMRFRFVLPVVSALGLIAAGNSYAAEPFCPKGSNPDPSVIWCDSFENEDLGSRGTVQENYFEFNDAGGDFRRTGEESVHGSYALRADWAAGQVSAGWMIRTFGRNPISSQSHSSSNFRELYWRYYTKLEDGFISYPNKSSRATIFANSNRAQAMIAHIWAGSSDRAYLSMDPATGIENDRLVTTKYNDFDNLTWLGARKGITPFKAGKWYCVEAHVKLNTPGYSNGVFEFFIDGNLQARRTDLNWVGRWDSYGLNTLSFENYWNGGSPADQSRFLDALVVSTKPIGCLASQPNPPTDLNIR